VVGGDDVAQVFRVYAGRHCRQADEFGEHHRDLAASGRRYRRRPAPWQGLLRNKSTPPSLAHAVLRSPR
jgi:hypothetical protein